MNELELQALDKLTDLARDLAARQVERVKRVELYWEDVSDDTEAVEIRPRLVVEMYAASGVAEPAED